ncbi:MAG: (d)CMP kinase, partial [Solirubrobacterales bacterium]
LRASGEWAAAGRDIGTAIAPPAELKLFLTAHPQDRAGRRAQEPGRPVGEVLAEQAERDARDGEREISPLRPADDAVELDTSGLAVDEVCRQVEALVAQRRGPGDGQ